MMRAICSILLLILVEYTEQQFWFAPSPCPSIFSYDTDRSNAGRWYGIANLPGGNTGKTVILNIIIDKKANILGNHLGEVTTSDNVNYRIRIKKLKSPVFNFFVQYEPLDLPPKLAGIKVNEIEICNLAPPTEIPALLNANQENDAPSLLPTPDETPFHLPTFYFPPSSTASPTTSTTTTPTPTTSTPAPKTCGEIAKLSQPFILNGKVTQEKQLPWQIALYQAKSISNIYVCGGTLVSLQHIVTAAHCATLRNSKRAVNPSILTVYLGKHNLKTQVNGVQIKLVSKIILHPDYNPSVYENDLAVLKLRGSVDYTDWVRPACLWPENQVDLRHVEGKSGLVVGWGFNEKDAMPEELTLVEMPVVTKDSCMRAYPEFFGRYTFDFTFCAGFKNGSTICNGDSGGGMIFNMEDRWYVRGLISLSIAKRSDNRCHPENFVIFTDLAKHLPWIKKQLNE